MPVGYVNHYLMKQNRILVLEEADYKCQLCGAKAIHVHHKDHSLSNHDPENLMPVCAKCHKKLHGSIGLKWDGSMVKAAMMHRGVDAKELAVKVGVSYETILRLLKGIQVKNNTMKQVAEALDYPIEFFIVSTSDISDLKVQLKRQTKKQEAKNRYDHLDKAIEERLNALSGGRRSLRRYWLTKELRECFRVRSYTMVADIDLQRAICLINKWSPGVTLSEIDQAAARDSA